MNQHCSIILTLHGNGENWLWDINMTVNGGRETSFIIPFPKKISPTDLHKKIFKNIKLAYPIQVRNLGIDFFKIIFSPEIIDKLKSAANFDRSDINFKVPLEWANVPFELCYLPQKKFLGQIFQIGTKILVETLPKDLPSSKTILIITDWTEKARQEGMGLKKIANKNNWDVHVLLQASTSKILSEMEAASVVHYAGHFPKTGNGWKLDPSQIFNISDMEKLGNCYSIPNLIFSNCCRAGNCSNGYNLSGIAGIFLKAGVKQVIGPVSEINEDKAGEFALSFYEAFFKGKSTAESLLVAKKDMNASYKNTVTPLLYRFFGDTRDEPIHNITSGTDTPPDSKGEKTNNVEKTKNGKKYKGLKILFGVISFLLLCLLIWFVIKTIRKHDKNQEITPPQSLQNPIICLGITDYRIDPNGTEVKKELTEICRLAKGKLRLDTSDKGKVYQFKNKVVPGNYKDILTYLKKEKIDIAFVSPYCYIFVKYLEPNKLEGLEFVGVKRHWSSLTYNSGFLVRNDSGIKELGDINVTTVNSFILGHLYSTSTSVIPFIFLAEHGLTGIKFRREPERDKKVKEIINSKAEEKVIAALSNEDWRRLISQNKDLLRFLHFIPINIPIPYDAVFVNKDSWEKRFNKKERDMILDALSDSIKKVPESMRWEKEYPDFVDYVASGIITRKLLEKDQQKGCREGGCFIVYLPKREFDLYHLNNLVSDKKPIKYGIYRFKGDIRPSIEYYLEKIKVGSGMLIKKNNLTNFDNEVLLFNPNIESENINNLVGLHVLPESGD